jgi:dihydroorotase
MNEGTVSTLLGLKGIPAPAEEVMVSRDLLLAEYTGAPIHIAHVSTERSVDLVRHAKARGVKVTCETCPHYFSLTDDAVLGFDTNAKVNPPLREKSDVEAIIEGLCDGTIDIIATDHAPHHADEKNIEFELAANGISGFEIAFGLSYTYLVKPGYLTLVRLTEKMSRNPRRLFGLEGGIYAGAPADITIVDINREYTVDTSAFVSKGKNSPFHGLYTKGMVMQTIKAGRVVYSLENSEGRD